MCWSGLHAGGYPPLLLQDSDVNGTPLDVHFPSTTETPVHGGILKCLGFSSPSPASTLNTVLFDGSYKNIKIAVISIKIEAKT